MRISDQKEIHQLVVKDAKRDLWRKPSLRRIEREHVHYLNQISSTRAPLVFEWLSRSWRMTMQPISSPALTYAEKALIDWGGAEVVLRLEHALVGAAMNSLLETQSVGALEGEIRNLVIDGAFVGLSEMIEERFRKRFRLIQTSPESDSSVVHVPRSKKNSNLHGFMVFLSDGDTDYTCEAWIDDLALGFLADAIRFWPIRTNGGPNWEGLSIPLMITAGWTTLSLQTIRRLNLNDVILLDECLLGGDPERILIRLGERFGLEAELHKSSITVTHCLEGIMEDIDELDESGEDFPQVDSGNEAIEQIPVRLYFDLGERVMTLGELKTLGPGYVIELGRELRRSVAIRVNGKKIGEGELVDIDGSIGVSVLAINTPMQ